MVREIGLTLESLVQTPKKLYLKNNTKIYLNVGFFDKTWKEHMELD